MEEIWNELERENNDSQWDRERGDSITGKRSHNLQRIDMVRKWAVQKWDLMTFDHGEFGEACKDVEKSFIGKQVGMGFN